MSNSHILYISDKKISSALKNTFQSSRFDVTFKGSASKGIKESYSNGYGLIVVDVGAGDREGVEFCARVRAEGIETPIIILLNNYSVLNVVKLFEAGADAYLTQPVSLQLLLARCKSIIKRSPKSVPIDIRIGDISINRDKRLVIVDHQIVHLRRREFEILLLLAENPGRVFTRHSINMRTMTTVHTSNNNVVDVHVSNLRKTLSEYNVGGLIETVHGVGYRLNL